MTRAHELNHEQTKHVLETGARALTRLIADLDALHARAQAARPDGYPRGGDGARGSDVSNPTLAAVIARENNERDYALTALDRATRGVDLLINADHHRAAALPPIDAEPEAGVDLCIACLRIGSNSPPDTSPHFAQPNRYCTFCSGWRRKHRFDPPDLILLKRKEGRRITSADETAALLEHKRSKRKKRR